MEASRIHAERFAWSSDLAACVHTVIWMCVCVCVFKRLTPIRPPFFHIHGILGMHLLRLASLMETVVQVASASVSTGVLCQIC